MCKNASFRLILLSLVFRLSHSHTHTQITNESPKMLAMVQSPSFVRKIDWIDNCWPMNRKGRREGSLTAKEKKRELSKNPHSMDLIQVSR